MIYLDFLLFRFFFLSGKTKEAQDDRSKGDLSVWQVDIMVLQKVKSPRREDYDLV